MSTRSKFEINFAERFPHLSAAPIVEGVIHWRAKGKSDLDADHVRSLLIEMLPDYPEIQPQQEFKVDAEMREDGPVTRVHGTKWTGFRFFSPDKLYVAQFTIEGFVFSRLQPYSSWEVFVSEAKRLWQIFVHVFEPVKVQRLGVRFINRIVPIDPSDLERLLQRPPECLSRVGMPMTSFMLQAMHEIPGHPFQVQVTQAIQSPSPPETTHFGLIIDIDVSTTSEVALTEDELDRRLMEMRWLKNKAFVSVLTPAAVESFKGQ